MNYETADAHERWLSPSDALNRFHPPEGTSIGVHSPAAAQSARFGFRVGQLRLLIKPNTLSEVIMHTSIYPMPNVPGWFTGVMNLRSNLLPVFDLHQLLGMGDSDRDKWNVLILDQGSDGVGIRIDGLPQSVAPNRVLRQAPPLHEALEAHVPAAYATDGAIWLEFDHQSFFTTLGQQLAS